VKVRGGGVIRQGYEARTPLDGVDVQGQGAKRENSRR
jgi:hypothetical protein